jgi:hypothetical protein
MEHFDNCTLIRARNHKQEHGSLEQLLENNLFELEDGTNMRIVVHTEANLTREEVYTILENAICVRDGSVEYVERMADVAECCMFQCEVEDQECIMCCWWDPPKRKLVLGFV